VEGEERRKKEKREGGGGGGGGGVGVLFGGGGGGGGGVTLAGLTPAGARMPRCPVPPRLASYYYVCTYHSSM